MSNAVLFFMASFWLLLGIAVLWQDRNQRKIYRKSEIRMMTRAYHDAWNREYEKLGMETVTWEELSTQTWASSIRCMEAAIKAVQDAS